MRTRQTVLRILKYPFKGSGGKFTLNSGIFRNFVRKYLTEFAKIYMRTSGARPDVKLDVLHYGHAHPPISHMEHVQNAKYYIHIAQKKIAFRYLSLDFFSRESTRPNHCATDFIH